MKIPIGELLDRQSILLIKQKNGYNVSEELNLISAEIKNYENLDFFTTNLYNINERIWTIKQDIKRGVDCTLSDSDLANRTVELTQLNYNRNILKDTINIRHNEGFRELRQLDQKPPVVVTLSTVPQRLSFIHPDGVELVIRHLCEQKFDNYEVHFNIPEFYPPTNEPYIIPEWLNEYQKKYPHLKVFRTEDYGPATKVVPTIQRITDPETIIIVVDDDIVYYDNMVQEHFNHHLRYDNAVFGYDGRSNCSAHRFNDLRDAWVLCLETPSFTHMIQHYKSGSYKRKYFESDFFEHFVGKTKSDDVLTSYYCRYKRLDLIIMPYVPENHLYDTPEKWKANQGVGTFPIIKTSNAPMRTGATHPEMEKIEPRFYTPPIFEQWIRDGKIT